MSNNIDGLLNQIEVLPAAPSLLGKLLPKLSDTDAHFDEIVDVIALDPGLTAKLLQICNSAFFGQTEPILSVQDAVARVGYQSIYLLVAMISGADAFPVTSANGLNIGRLWGHSITTAFSSKYIAESTRQDGNILFTAGLLHDIGKIVLAQIQPTIVSDRFYQLSEAESLAHEKETYGYNHAEIGTALMKRWKLPEQLIVAVSHHHEPRHGNRLEPLAACLELGDSFSHGQTDRRVLSSPTFMSRLNALEVGPQDMQQWFKKLASNQAVIDGMSQLKAGSQPSRN